MAWELIVTIVGGAFLLFSIFFDPDVGYGGKWFSLLSVSSFATIFGIVMYGTKSLPWVLSLAIALGAGVGTAILLRALIGFLEKSSDDESESSIESFVTAEGKVITDIPGGDNAYGQIVTTVNGNVSKLNAVSDVHIPMGNDVYIIEVIDGSTVRVNQV